MKKLLLLIACVAMSMVSCVSKSEYKKKMGEAISKMEIVLLASSFLAEDHREVWDEAIDNNKYRGSYCSDFHEALTKNKMSWDESDYCKKMSAEVDGMKVLVKDLNDYPNDYEDAYNDAVEIYTSVLELNEIAVSPTGNLRSYTARINDVYNEANKSITKFKVKYLEN